MANIGGDQVNPGIRIFHLPGANGFLRERVQVRTTSCQGGKLYLKADERQVGQRYEDVQKKQVHCHIIIFPERT